MKIGFTVKLKTSNGTLDFSKYIEGTDPVFIYRYAFDEFNRAMDLAERIGAQGFYEKTVNGKTDLKKFSKSSIIISIPKEID
jgi:hypothetical protein